MKGRRVSPPPIPVVFTGATLTVAQAIEKMQSQPGVYRLEERHEHHCPAWRTQSEDDCICEPTYRLWSLKERVAQ